MTPRFKDRAKTSLNGYEDALASYDVLIDGVHIGHVEQVESSKTGFRRGCCVGQVACKVWRAYDLGGRRVGDNRGEWYTGNGSRTRKDAAALLVAAAIQRPNGTP